MRTAIAGEAHRVAIVAPARFLLGSAAVRIALPLLALGCTEADVVPAEAPDRLPEVAYAGGFAPIPEDLGLDARRVAIGRRLFEDRRVSGDGQRACVDCHDLAQGGIVPGEARSNHPVVPTGPYNVPTVFNVGFNFRYNWQGQFETLEAHLGGPMMNANVMAAGSWPALVGRLEAAYRADFVAAGYADGVTEASIRDAFATWERSLATPGARFDRWLQGEDVLTDEETRGFELFRDLGCASCHQGMNVGGNLFQRFGVVEDAFDGRPLAPPDYGRQAYTGLEEDAHVFRVPSLRNVALTAPYFHDGSAPTLDAAVRHMARVQLGYALDDDEVAELTAFLGTLTGTWEGVPLDAGRP
ncbi:MAG: cytochrome-c peroxidase [Myxococcota bacterium]